MADIRVETGNREDAFEVRRVVFIEEQGYENEYDELDEDPGCIHVTLYVDGELAGCARTFSHAAELATVEDTAGVHALPTCDFDADATDETTYVLGRVAVLPTYRRQGLASKIVVASEDAARAAGACIMKLHAQEYVRDLYAQLGYVQISEVDYEEEGQPHLWMAKSLL